MSKIAYVFPGQGSQSVGMMSDWGDYQAIIDAVFDEASERLGYDLRATVANGPEERLNQTEITQPAMLCAGVASWNSRPYSAVGVIPRRCTLRSTIR